MANGKPKRKPKGKGHQSLDIKTDDAGSDQDWLDIDEVDISEPSDDNDAEDPDQMRKLRKRVDDVLRKGNPERRREKIAHNARQLDYHSNLCDEWDAELEEERVVTNEVRQEFDAFVAKQLGRQSSPENGLSMARQIKRERNPEIVASNNFQMKRDRRLQDGGAKKRTFSETEEAPSPSLEDTSKAMQSPRSHVRGQASMTSANLRDMHVGSPQRYPEHMPEQRDSGPVPRMNRPRGFDRHKEDRPVSESNERVDSREASSASSRHPPVSRLAVRVSGMRLQYDQSSEPRPRRHDTQYQSTPELAAHPYASGFGNAAVRPERRHKIVERLRHQVPLPTIAEHLAQNQFSANVDQVHNWSRHGLQDPAFQQSVGPSSSFVAPNIHQRFQMQQPSHQHVYCEQSASTSNTSAPVSSQMSFLSNMGREGQSEDLYQQTAYVWHNNPTTVTSYGRTFSPNQSQEYAPRPEAFAGLSVASQSATLHPRFNGGLHTATSRRTIVSRQSRGTQTYDRYVRSPRHESRVTTETKNLGARPKKAKQKTTPPLPELDNFAWDEENQVWTNLDDLAVRTRTAMEEHTWSLCEGDHYASHYWRVGDRRNGICSGCQYTQRNSSICDAVPITDNHLACDTCCNNGRQPCGTLIEHPDPSSELKYAMGYVPLPLDKRLPGSSRAELHYWLVHPDIKTKSPEKPKKMRERLMDKVMSGKEKVRSSLCLSVASYK